MYFWRFLVHKNGYQENTKNLGLPNPPPYLGLSPKFYHFFSVSLSRDLVVVAVMSEQSL